MGKAQTIAGVFVAALAGASAMAPVAANAADQGTDSRLAKLEERVRDTEARLAKVESMVNQHSAHGAQQQGGSQAMPQGGKGSGMGGMGSGGMGGGMMDDDMMGMPPAQGQQNPQGQQPMGDM